MNWFNAPIQKMPGDLNRRRFPLPSFLSETSPGHRNATVCPIFVTVPLPRIKVNQSESSLLKAKFLARVLHSSFGLSHSLVIRALVNRRGFDTPSNSWRWDQARDEARAIRVNPSQSNRMINTGPKADNK
jgi:hypothetical protein